jgi:hypothetical protein
MNRYLAFVFLFFVVGYLVINSNIIFSNIISGVEFSLNTLFKDDYYYNHNNNKNYYYSYVNKALVFDFIPAVNAQEEQKEKDNYEDHDDNAKYVILIFDRGYKSTFTKAKPILDKYDFKVSIFVACRSPESPKGMTWDQLRQLQNEGHDIQSHGSEHTRLVDIKSYEQIESIVKEGKECLQEQGFSPTVFQVPYNKGGNDPKIVDIISRYFDFAFMGHSKLMFLNCDGWENFGYGRANYEGITDCSPYSSDGTPKPTNRYAMKEWSHDRGHDKIYEKRYLGEDPHGEKVNDAVLKQFIKIIESQTNFTKDGKINAIPIIGYHKIDTGKDYYTSPELFKKEMEYLYQNNIKVITLADLGYDEKQQRFYITNDNQNGNELSQFQKTQ